MEHQTFTQQSNRERDIEAVSAEYEDKIKHDLWMAEAVQKDAVQNSWDNVDLKRRKEWKCIFSLLNIANKKFFTILDEGTTGLIGTKFQTQEELVKILLENKKEEDLAYFLNSNWSAKTGAKGGTRGRGKMMFLAASKESKIFFDSLRSTDNEYVFGEVYLDTDKEIRSKLYWNKYAKERISEVTSGKISPLFRYGTRIMIVDPYQSMEKALKEGDLLSFINNTWWEIIKKFNAQIIIESEGEIKKASIPFWYQDVFTDEQKELIFKNRIKLWSAESIKDDYRTKKLILRYVVNENLPNNLRGLAIQRGGMTIERVSIRDFIHDEGANNIYGWIEMDGEEKEGGLSYDMKKNCENPQHFDFRWHSKPATYLKKYLGGKVSEFAKEFKLSESDQSKVNKTQKLAAEKAAKTLGPLFKKLGLIGSQMGGKKDKKKHNRKENEKLRLSASDFQLPNDTSRVNYGDKIKGLYVIPINETNREFMILIKVFLVLPDGKAKIIEEREFNLKPGNGPKIGVDFLDILDDYKKGGYSFRAKMISEEDTDYKLLDGNNVIEKGTILYDRINKKFYVNIDPPDTGFLSFILVKKDEKTYLMDWQSQGKEGYTIYYNENHPKIKPLITDEEKLSHYLIEQGGLVAFQIKLEESDFSENEEDDEFGELINSLAVDSKNDVIKILPEVFPIIFKKFSKFLWYYSSE